MKRILLDTNIYGLIAVDNGNGAKEGTIRIKAKTMLSRLEGICVDFKDVSGQISMAAKEPFFYGTNKTLQANGLILLKKIFTLPPEGVYLIAFSKRFDNTRFR